MSAQDIYIGAEGAGVDQLKLLATPETTESDLGAAECFPRWATKRRT